MASRMDRYYKTEERSKKNANLYKEIGELGTYTNIEGIASIENTNEINIQDIKKMLQSREEYQRNREYKDFVKKNEQQEAPIQVVPEEEKNYDLKDILSKAKIDHSDKNIKYRNLKNSQFDILKNLNINNKEDEEIENIIINENNGDDLGIFDELKSNTMVGDAASIKKILTEAKQSEEAAEKEREEETKSVLDNLDKSFYTNSFNFSDKDFEDIRNLDSSLKTNNKLIKILIIVFSVLIAIVLLVVIAKMVF
jgi:hypothetical protein